MDITEFGLFFNNNHNFYLKILAQSFFREYPKQVAISTQAITNIQASAENRALGQAPATDPPWARSSVTRNSRMQLIF